MKFFMLFLGTFILTVATSNFCFAEVQISANEYHAIGLRSNGDVVALGKNESGQCNVNSWHDIKQVVTGTYTTFGLKSDGTIVSKGQNEKNQRNVGDWKEIKQIATMGGHVVGLKHDGTVVAKGGNTDGQLEVGSWRNIEQIAAGWSHTVGLKSDGTVVAVGSNWFGECNTSTWDDIVQISAGGGHTVGLKADGTVLAVGGNEEGQCNVSSWKDIIEISAGLHTVGLKKNGEVVAVGSNDEGQCNVDKWSDILKVFAGIHMTFGIKSDGSVITTTCVTSPDGGDWNICDLRNWNLFDARYWDLNTVPFDETLPLNNQPITEISLRDDIENIYNEFYDAEIKSEYETKEEYINRVKNFYQDQPIYFFRYNSRGSYDAESKTLTINIPDSKVLAGDALSGWEYNLILKNDSFFEPIKFNMSPEIARSTREKLAVILGVEFKYVYGIYDFENSSPKGVVYSEIDYFLDRYRYTAYYLIAALKSVTVYNSENDNILYQKHMFESDSLVWNYSVEDETEDHSGDTGDSEDDSDQGSGSGGGCFLKVLD